MEYAVEAENITKHYEKTRALDNLSIKVKRGDFFGFLGPNGAGKTTFVKILLNLVFPDSGTARILNQDTRNHEARLKVGFLPENVYVYPFLTIEEFMEFHSKLLNMTLNKRNEDIRKLLKLTGMYNDRKKKMGALSKGMKQRVGIAQALLNDPDLVILDEPTSGLDPIGIKDIRDILTSLKNTQTTVFLNSHLLSEIEKTCDTLAILSKGRIIKSGSKLNFSEEEKWLEIAAEGMTDKTLEQINSISAKQAALADGCIKVYLQKEDDSIKVHEIILKNGGRLQSLAWKGESLEDIFYRIVKKEEKEQK